MSDAQTIVILDFGSQYTQLIARRIREQNVFSVVLPCTASLEEVCGYRPAGIILSGGPSSVYDADAPPADVRVLELGPPVLGICYGLHFIVHSLGGKVRPAPRREYGHADMELTAPSPLFRDIPSSTPVWMSHGDEALELPPGFNLVARSGGTVAAMEHPQRRIWAVQFHPEVHHTRLGTQILRNFLFDICGVQANWTAQRFIDETVAQVREKVGPDGRAICALSGGVDSGVAATLVHRAIGDRLTCVFVDNGVLRLNEFQKVQQSLRDRLGLHLVAVDAGARFLNQLSGVTDPERKRRIIGAEFIAVFEEEARRVAQEQGHVEFLVQGTLYPDVIESRSVRGPSQTIKSHHNVGGLPEKMDLKLIEPLKDLFKDEVRRIGRDLGMPEDILQRQPFPGPGLAVRIVGEITPERIGLLQAADDIVVGEIKRAGLYTKIWQSFAVLLPVMSVGVMGDQRTYAYTCAIRAVHSEDGMTADVVELPWDVLKRISSRKAPQLQQRSYDRFIEELRNLDNTAYERARNRVGEAAFLALKTLDNVTNAIGFLAVYNKTMAESGNELYATETARDFILRTRPAARGKDLASLYCSRGLGWFLLFGNQQNQQWNVLTADVYLGLRRAARGDWSQLIKATTEVVGIAVGAIGMTMLAGKKLPEEPEDWVNGLMASLFGNVPLVGNYIEDGLRGEVQRRGLNPFGDVYYVGRLIEGITSGDDMERVTRDAMHAMIGVSQLFGMPVVQLKRFWRAAETGDWWWVVGGPPKE